MNNAIIQKQQPSLLVCVLIVSLLVNCSPPDDAPPEIAAPEFRWQNLDTLLWAEMLAAEDARADTPESLEPIVSGLTSPIPEVRVLAVRALGRLERAEHVLEIAPLLADTIPAVRAEAANSLGQAVFRGGAGAALGPLLERLGAEPDAYVRGIVAQTLGRLPYESDDTVRLVDAALVGALEDSVPAALAGMVRGLASLVRLQGAGSPPSGRAVERLRELARHGLQYRTDNATLLQIRRLAVAALGQSGQVDFELLSAIVGDRDAQVRRLAVGAASSLDESDSALEIVARALGDEDATVRLRALQAYSGQVRSGSDCVPVLAAVDDLDPDVALTAIDILGRDCAAEAGVVERLVEIVESLNALDGNEGFASYPNSWHRPAHALVSLSGLAPDIAAGQLDAFSLHSSWWVRTYAARAATNLDSAECLERLASDEHDLVRNAAVAGLSQVLGHDADAHYIRQLSRQDYQLVMTAARALEGTPNRVAAMPSLFDALDRITAQRRETSRDARRALIRRIGSLGGRSQAVALIPYLRDFDPIIAEDAATVLHGWTGRSYTPNPRLLPRLSLPSYGDLARVVGQRAVLEMRGGGRIEIELFPFEAPTNVTRFVRLAQEGYFDGLTFHRLSRNFVIQGGSPGANEFVGDGPYTRDEVVYRSNLRGTVGISTRGRDTGDGQIFVNLIDNPRLDHNYTIIGEVVAGLDVVDAVLEGAVIERVSWRQSESNDETL